MKSPKTHNISTFNSKDEFQLFLKVKSTNSLSCGFLRSQRSSLIKSIILRIHRLGPNSHACDPVYLNVYELKMIDVNYFFQMCMTILFIIASFTSNEITGLVLGRREASSGKQFAGREQA